MSCRNAHSVVLLTELIKLLQINHTLCWIHQIQSFKSLKVWQFRAKLWRVKMEAKVLLHFEMQEIELSAQSSLREHSARMETGCIVNLRQRTKMGMSWKKDSTVRGRPSLENNHKAIKSFVATIYPWHLQTLRWVLLAPPCGALIVRWFRDPSSHTFRFKCFKLF